MKNTSKSLGFPTQGEALHFIFEAAGVLPRKRGEFSDFDETAKKTIQKILSRLASEEGGLNEQFRKMVEMLGGIVAEVNSSPKVNATIREIVFDAFEVYQNVLRTDGSYKDKPETVRWFLSSYLINRLVQSVNKHLLRFNVADLEFIVPNEPFWYLPTKVNGKITWPLEKVMRWAYLVCETSQTHFHYPSRKAGIDNFEQQQNLDNAANWLSGKNLPSWGALLWNFNKSFESLSCCKDDKCNRVISEKAKESIRLALFVARSSTFITKEIYRQYGDSYLMEVCDQYQRYSGYINEDVTKIKGIVADNIHEHAISKDQCNPVWLELVSKYWEMLSDRSIECSSTIEHIMEGGETSIPEPTVKALVGHYGSATVLPILEWMEMQGLQKFPPEFAEQLFAGLDLKASSTTQEQDIKLYEQKLNASEVRDLLPWMVPWLRAFYLYRQESYEDSFGYFQLAFNLGKYCAGRYQYKLVNQYIEVSAKTNRWREFKKGVEWAQYLGQEVRWLRDQDPTDENLRNVFGIMKLMRYSD